MNNSLMIGNRQSWFGNGSLAQLVPLLQASPQKTLLFSCRSFLQGPQYAALADQLAPLFVATEIISHEASPLEIDALVACYRGNVERVVAIGGGSVIDAAKAFSAMVLLPKTTLHYLEKVGDSKPTGETLPLIAIPTTAGTGSEVTQNAVLTDTYDIQVKASLRHANYVPQLAIIDPSLLKGTPDHLLAWCAIDAFTHLFEAYLSKTASAWSRQLSLTGIQLFIRAWPALNRADEQGDTAREQIMQAAYLGGLTLSMSGLGVIHGIAGEIGALVNYHHGQVCGRLLLPFLGLLAATENREQQTLMTELAVSLGLPVTNCSARYLSELITQQAISPFWEQEQPLTAQQLATILAKSNSKNSLIDYSEQQRHQMIAAAYQLED